MSRKGVAPGSGVCGIEENGGLVLNDLKETRAGCFEFHRLPDRRTDLKRAGLKGRQHGGMINKNTEKTSSSGDVKIFDIPVKKDFLWCYNGQVQRVRHGSTRLQRFRLFKDFLNGPDHVKCLFRDIVHLAVDDHLKTIDRILKLHITALGTREILGHEHGL